jgi:hypothetical protein
MRCYDVKSNHLKNGNIIRVSFTLKTKTRVILAKNYPRFYMWQFYIDLHCTYGQFYKNKRAREINYAEK